MEAEVDFEAFEEEEVEKPLELDMQIDEIDEPALADEPKEAETQKFVQLQPKDKQVASSFTMYSDFFRSRARI